MRSPLPADTVKLQEAIMEHVQNRVQTAVSDMIKTLDKDNFRKMQAKMYQCSAACCENQHYNMEDVQRCLENCSTPVNRAQSFMQTELGGFQDRIQRCAMDCQDHLRDKITPNTSEGDISKYRATAEQCVVKCADTHIALLPAMMKRVKEVLQQPQ